MDHYAAAAAADDDGDKNQRKSPGQ